jgi:LicD family
MIRDGEIFRYMILLLAVAVSVVSSYKYFEEPRGRDLEHYDARFFRGKVSAEKRLESLSGLIVAFLDIMEAEGIVTWLAHGTLLGWYWNGHSLPW